MAIVNPNVIDIGSRKPHESSASAPSANEVLIREGRKIVSDHFSKILSAFFEKIDDELFALSDKAENSSLQSMYFDSMRYVRRERSSMQQHYLRVIEKSYDNFWKGGVGKVHEVDQTADEFSLMDEDELEEDLAITTMAEKGENRFQEELFALDRRLAVLRGVKEISEKENPLAPLQLCQAFKEMVSQLNLGLEIKLVIYKLFDRMVVAQLGGVYEALNALLVRQGILPKIKRKINKNADEGVDQGDQVDEFAEDDETIVEEVNDPAQVEFFNSLQNLLRSRRQLAGNGLAEAFNGPVYESVEVMNALNLVQNALALQSISALPVGEGFKGYISDSLRGLQVDNANRPFAVVEEDMIDMVGMIFDYILEDRNIPDPIKTILGRLQIPVLKVALLDKGVFSRKAHPARKLLDQLSKAGSRLGADDCRPTNPVFAEIETIVDLVLNDFDQNRDLFQKLLGQFEGFLEKDEKRCQVLEVRARQVSESKEKLLLAKKQVAFELANKMQGRKMPALIKTFIEESWKDVILLAALRQDQEPAVFERTVKLVDRLIRSVTPPGSEAQKKEILADLPLLLKEIKIGLENIMFDPHEMARIFKDLEHCHRVCLRGVVAEEEDACEPVDEVLLPERSEVDIERECDEIFLGEYRDSSSEVVEEIVLSTTPDLDAFDVSVEEANEAQIEVEVGQWFDYTVAAGEVVRVKLSWMSQVTSVSLFINKKGQKVLEICEAELKALLRDGRLQPANLSRVPLVERAMSAMMDRLKGDREEISPQPV